jgi:hypothetical protein
MDVMTEIKTFSDTLFADWSFSSSASGLIFVLLYFTASWLVCVAGAFCKVRETQFYVGLLSVGMGLVVSFLLAGICRFYLPDLASSFTPWGLMIFSMLISALVFSVPLVQCFWQISYPRALMTLAGGYFLFLAVMLAVQVYMQPDVSLPARLKIPIFMDQTPPR